MYQCGSIIVVRKLPVESWYKMIGDSTDADVIPERHDSWEHLKEN